MAKCQSFAQLAAELYKEHQEVTKEVVSYVAAGVTTAKTGDVRAGLKVKRGLLEEMDKVTDVAEELQSRFMKVVGRTHNLTIGPRCLRLDRWEKGHLVSEGDRAFMTAAPLDSDSAKLRIVERGGKGKVRVRVCSFDEEGRHREHKEFEINENRSEKKDKDQSIVINLDNVEDRWISVILDGRGLTTSFKYKLMLDT